MLYNGRSYSFVDMKLTGFRGDVDLFRSGVRAIECSDEAKLVVPKGADPIPLPSGGAYDYSAKASLEMVLEVWERLIDTLDDAYSDERFDLVLTLGGRNLKQVKREFKEVQIIAPSDPIKRDAPDGQMVTLGLHVRYILRNGKCLVRR